MNHDEYVDFKRREFLDLCSSFLEGKLGVIEGVRLMLKLSLQLEAPEMDFSFLTLVDSETHEYPVGQLRAVYNKESLANVEKDFESYLSEVQPRLIDIVKRLKYQCITLTSVACPCCKLLTLSKRGEYEICSVCCWEDEGQDSLDDSFLLCDSNGEYTLSIARENFKAHGDMYSLEDENYPTNENYVELRDLLVKLYQDKEIDWDEIRLIEDQMLVTPRNKSKLPR